MNGPNWAAHLQRAQDNYGQFIGAMGQTCDIKRRPPDSDGIGTGDRALVMAGVPFFATQTGELLLVGSPYLAAEEQSSESGTVNPYMIEMPVRVTINGVPTAVDVRQGDLLVGPLGNYIVKEVATDETAPMSWIIRAEGAEI